MTDLGPSTFALCCCANQSLPGTLFLREGESDPPRTLAREVLADWMIASQDGSYLLFGVHDSDHSQADSSRIFSLDVSTGKTTDLLPFSFNTGFDPKRILLVEQIGRVLVNSFRGEKTGLLSIPLEGGEVESILPQRRMKMTTDPAGRFLYYTLHSNEIWRLRFEDGERTMVHRLTASSSIGALFVSREGDLLTIRTSLPRIYQYDASNGRTRRLFPDTDTRLIDVSGNGEWMLIESSQDLTAENPDGSRELFLCGINGGNCRQLTRIASPGLIRPLVYDPPPAPKGFLNQDGTVGLISAGGELPDPRQDLPVRNLYRVATETREFRLLDSTGGGDEVDFPQALDGDSHVAFGAGPPLTDGWRFVVARADGKQFVPVSPDVKRIRSAAYSADASTIAYRGSRREGEDVIQELWVHRVGEGRTFRVAELNLGPPCLLPNAFSCPPAPSQIRSFQLDASGNTLVIASEVGLRAQDTEETRYLYQVDLNRAEDELLLVGHGANPNLSGDGQVLAWTEATNLYTGRLAKGGITEVISHGEGSRPALSRDGRRLVYLRDGQAFLAEREGASPIQLGPLDLVSIDSFQISSEGDRVAVLIEESFRNEEFRLFDGSGKQVDRFGCEPPIDVFSWSLSPAAKRIFFTSSSPLLNNLDRGRDLFVLELEPVTSYVPGLPNPEESLVGLSVTNTEAGPVDLQLSLLDPSGEDAGQDLEGPFQTVDAGEQVVALLQEILPGASEGTLRLRSSAEVAGIALFGSYDLDRMMGVPASGIVARDWLFPLFDSLRDGDQVHPVKSFLIVFNPNAEAVEVSARLNDPLFPKTRRFTVSPGATVRIDATATFLRASAFWLIERGLLEVSASSAVQSRMELTLQGDVSAAASLPGLEVIQTSPRLTFPFAVAGFGMESWLCLSNPQEASSLVQIEMRNRDGNLICTPLLRRLLGNSVRLVAVSQLSSESAVGSLQVTGLGDARVGGALLILSPAGASFLAYLPSMPSTGSLPIPFSINDSQLAASYAIANPYPFPVQFHLEVFDRSGALGGSRSGWLPAGGQSTGILPSLAPLQPGVGHSRIASDWPLPFLVVVGKRSGESLALLSP